VPHRDWRRRVEDILEAIARIERYAKDHDEASFLANDMAVDAVVRNVAIIGEAAGRIPADVRSLHAEIPWEKMRGMRNVLVHEYFDIGHDLLWGTIQDDLPLLGELLRKLLEHER
jgi:uncharacterized protein with HEPN domain